MCTHAAAVFKDKIWMVGGVSTSYYTKRLEKTTTRSDVVYSSDGAAWVEALEEAPFRRRFGHSLMTFTDQRDGVERLLLIAGFSPEPATDIWMTANGETWTEATALGAVPWTGRGYHCSVVFAKKLWILGGSPLNNDVWSATSVLEGGTWEQQQNVPWSPRAAHACASHTVMKNTTLGDASREEFLFVVGGWRETSKNDVWRMDAAGSWTQLTEAAPWKKRAWHSVVSFDSRTIGDVTLGPRLWLFGGGIVGSGITKMFPYSDVWFTRDGVEWFEASSDESGISTAEWSMVSTRDKDVCTGKWGHAVIAFRRMVDRAYYCSATCRNQDMTISHANQLIPVCNTATLLPDAPILRTILRGTSVTTVTLYPDGCGVCSSNTTADRYVNATTVPALFVIAGNIGAQKVKDVFRSTDASKSFSNVLCKAGACGDWLLCVLYDAAKTLVLCEKNGVICSEMGVCTLGGTCLCNSGKTGPFCDSDLDYTFLDETNCFPESAQVMTLVRGETVMRKVAISSVAVGDQVFAIGANGAPVLSTVYYIPHEPRPMTGGRSFLRIHHEFESPPHPLPDLPRYGHVAFSDNRGSTSLT
uniref:EGF-like domain-containing protein n=1 Tax=Globisporangium ultimum (strain ATCC 200006 / CBS 805.95 / DAOM BR144) TaxID=431595 RepID=K3W6L7_GLOUD